MNTLNLRLHRENVRGKGRAERQAYYRDFRCAGLFLMGPFVGAILAIPPGIVPGTEGWTIRPEYAAYVEGRRA